MIVIIAAVAGWFVLAIAGALMLGRMVAVADEQEPVRYELAA